MSTENIGLLESKAKEIRRTIIQLFGKVGGGHFGGALSAVDILTVLYYQIMRIKPEKPEWIDRDRFILSKGHSCPGLYAILADKGYFSKEELMNTFEKIESNFTMHPDMKKVKGIDMSTGSLGHGLSVGVGMALAGKFDKKNYRVFVLIGDGETQEGSIWEASMAASHYKLDNLICIVDRNRLSNDGVIEDIISVEPLPDRWTSFGWQVKEINGHNMKEIIEVLKNVPIITDKPTAIIAHTIKSKGIPFMENKREYHRADVTSEQIEQALKGLG